MNIGLLRLVFGAVLFFFLGITSCGPEADKPQTGPASGVYSSPAKAVPVFIADSAFAHIEQQLSFGPRSPFSDGHQQFRIWVKNYLINLGWLVEEQEFSAVLANGTRGRGFNIIARWMPDATHRVLLAVHYDTRAVADHDPDPDRRGEPIPGADDGASGVGVLLELARLISADSLTGMGLDLILFDLEDQGNTGDPETWCLGAQYFSSNLDNRLASPRFGILLDMVGAHGARFAKEGYSVRYASQYVDRVWNTAHQLGFSGYFDMNRTGEVIDDHLFVNRIARIPMLNIINRPLNTNTGFGEYWHTHGDDIEIISKSTLRAVGQTVLQVLYDEAAAIL